MTRLSWCAAYAWPKISSEVAPKMHCTNCGTYIAPGPRFCAGCGASPTDPEATRIARPPHPPAPAPTVYQQSAPLRHHRPSEVGRNIVTVRPTLLFLKIGYSAAALGAILLSLLLA